MAYSVTRAAPPPDPMVAELRRRAHAWGLATFRVVLKESDLAIACSHPLREDALAALSHHRAQLEAYIRACPAFLSSLVPVPIHPGAPPVVVRMGLAAATAGVGPMAAVAGALADEVGRALLMKAPEVFVENGGDIFCRVTRERIVAVDGGPSALACGLNVTPAMGALGICTSSGTRGGSLSFGRADAACVIAASAALADAAATAVGNAVVDAASIGRGLAVARHIPGVVGAVVIVGQTIGAWGAIELAEITE